MDHVTKYKRSAIMAAIRGKDATPELTVRRAAHAMGLRFRLHGSLPGRPDLVLAKWRTVVFVHGCFWHRHGKCRRSTIPKSNVDFWKAKFAANVKRDRRNRRRLTALGWKVIVVWQCQVPTIEAAAMILQGHFQG